MPEKSDVVITFRLPRESAGRLAELARGAPRLAGSPEPSRHQFARSIILEALEGKERMTKAKVVEAIQVLRRLIGNAPRNPRGITIYDLDAIVAPLDLLISSIKSDDYLDAEEGVAKIGGLLEKYESRRNKEERKC